MTQAMVGAVPHASQPTWAAVLLDACGKVQSHAGHWSGRGKPAVGQLWAEWLSQQKATALDRSEYHNATQPNPPLCAAANASDTDAILPESGHSPGLEQAQKSPTGQPFETIELPLPPPHGGRWVVLYPKAADSVALADTLDTVEHLQLQLQSFTQRHKLLEEELHGLTYAVSHDLLAPLRLIAGFAELVVETLPAESEDAREWSLAILQASQRAQAMTSDLLALARAGNTQIQLQAVDLSALAHSVCLDLQRAHPEHALQWQIESNLIVNSDAGLLRIVLENLLGNAWKFTVGTANPSLSISSDPQQNDRELCITIRDNGVGFDPAAAQRLFSPFQRLHPEEQFPGIGLGLAGARRLMRRCSGDIRATAHLGQGAAFTLVFATAPFGSLAL